MCRMWWPLTLTYIFKVIWPWLWKSCLLCNVFSSRSIIFLTWDPIVWVIMRRRGVSSERRRSSLSSLNWKHIYWDDGICGDHLMEYGHYSDIIMSAMASQITSLTIVYPTVYSGSDQRKHQSSASLAFVWGFHRWTVNSPHKRPVTQKMFPFDDVIMELFHNWFMAS